MQELALREVLSYASRKELVCKLFTRQPQKRVLF